LRGLSSERLVELRRHWYPSLARTPLQQVEYTTAIDHPPSPYTDLRDALDAAKAARDTGHDSHDNNDMSIDDNDESGSGVAWHGRSEEDFV
jgi:hypothetical protein